MNFKDPGDLNTYLRTSIPLFISYSAGYYEYPSATPMKKKNRLGADLIFDLDADDYEVKCDHGPGFVCKACMARVSEECSSLIENFLIPDFGFSKQDLNITFSGNRGYHVRVFDDSVLSLSSKARAEILEYMSAKGFEPRFVKPNTPTPGQGGWTGNITDLLVDYVQKQDKNGLHSIGVSFKTANVLIDNKDEFLQNVRNGTWPLFSVKRWQTIFKSIAAKKSVVVDKQVTLDVAKLLRVPETIHGGTGLVARNVKSLSLFNPFKDPIVFGSKQYSCNGKRDCSFFLSGQDFKVEQEKEVVLPEYAAVYAAAKGWVDVNEF